MKNFILENKFNIILVSAYTILAAVVYYIIADMIFHLWFVNVIVAIVICIIGFFIGRKYVLSEIKENIDNK